MRTKKKELEILYYHARSAWLAPTHPSTLFILLDVRPTATLAEACNAESNPEPLRRRWMRGLVPRGAREMIFGIGINQLSDACEERVSAPTGRVPIDPVWFFAADQ